MARDDGQSSACPPATARSMAARGIFCTLLGAVLWGFSGSCIQALSQDYGASALFLTACRMLGAGLVIAVYLAVRKRGLLSAIMRDRSSVIQLIIFGVFGLFACQTTYAMCILFTNGGTATSLECLSTIMIVIVTCVIMRRAPRPFEVVGALCAFVATVLIATKGDLGVLVIPPEGLGWGLASAVATVVFIMYPRRLFEKWGSVAATGLGMVVGGLAAVVAIVLFAAVHAVSGGVAGMPFELPVLDAYGAAILAAAVFIGSLAAYTMFLYGVSIIGSVKSSMLEAVEPVSASVFSALWLGTAFVWADWVGMTLMVATVLLVAFSDMRNG